MTTPALILTANDLMNGGLNWIFPGQKKNRVYEAGQLLTEETGGSSNHVNQQRNVQYASKVESSNDRVARVSAERTVEASRVSDNNFGNRTGTNYAIPQRIYG